MDRFVWFVLLVVMSHLVTEFTRVNGGNNAGNGRQGEASAMVNDSLALGKQVQSLVFFPAHEHAGYYPPIPPPPQQQQHQHQPYIQAPPPGYINANNNNHNHNNNNNGYSAPLVLPPATNYGSGNMNAGYNGVSGGIGATIGVGGQNNAAGTTTMAEVNGGGFSLRPLIDSIFEIPISTLRAVNNLVARLTGNYQHQSTPNGSYNNNNNNVNGISGRTASAFTSSSSSSASASASSDSIASLPLKAPMARAGRLLAALAAQENAVAAAAATASKSSPSSPSSSAAVAATTITTTTTTSKATPKSSLLREVNA